MEAMSSNVTPSIKFTPPKTPIKMTLKEPFNILPPLKSLPTWSRTNFVRGYNKKFPRSIPKDQKNEKENVISKYPHSLNRQCEMVSLNTSSSSSSSPSDKRKHLTQIYDKKIVFLQTSHQELLTHLHKEIEKLKNENKDLQYRLLVANETGLSNNHIIERITRDNEKTVVLLNHEIEQLKEQLDREKHKNSELYNNIEEQKIRSCSAYPKKASNSIDIICPSERNLKSAKHTHVNETGLIAEYKNHLKKFQLNTQQNELPHVREHMKDPAMSVQKSVVLPKIQKKPRSGLIKTAVNTSLKQRKETSLPSLTSSFSHRNLTDRQKKAHAIHVRRQKSNRNIELTILGTK